MMKTARRPALWAMVLFGILLLAAAGCSKPADQPLEITGVFPAAGAAGVPSDAAVEFTFTVPPDRLDEYVTIQPEVSGRFQYMNNVVAFIPDGSNGWDGEVPGRWQNETAYTVTVKAGLPAKEGKGTLAEDYVFSFTAQKEDALLFQMRHPYETFLPRDYPVLDLSRRSYWGEEEPPADGSFEVSVYPLADGESYKKELYRAATFSGEPRVDTGALTPTLTFTQGVAELTAAAGEDTRQLDIIFPETLAEGWYVATVTPSWNSGLAVQKLLQIQPSAVYTQAQQGEALVWFNSTADGKPVSGARMEIIADPFATDEAAFSVTAGEDGVMVVDYSVLGEDEESWPARGRYQTPFLLYSLTAPDGTVFYDILLNYHSLGRSPDVWQQYYGFLYTDRPIYHQDDTVKFWGVARPRKDAPALPAVSVELTHSGGSEPVATLELPVNPDGIFTGEVSYQGLASGELSLKAYPPEQSRDPENRNRAICEEYLGIAQYKKPIYTAGISADKLYYRLGEPISAQVEVSLFDRTPASGMKMLLTANNGGQEDETVREYTTGEDGLIHTSYTASLAEAPTAGWHPRSFLIHAANGDASDVDLSVNETVYVFPSSIMLELEEEHNKGTSTLHISTNQIDFGKIPGGRQVIQDYDTLRGDPAQVEVQVGIHKVSYTKVELPPYYDRYQKKSVPRYAYQRSEELVDHITRTTGADGTLVLQDLPNSGELTYYYAEVNLYQGGQQQQQTILLGDPWNCNPDERNAHFHTFQITTSLNQSEKGVYSYWGYYAFGEEARYRVADNGVPVEEGTVLTNLVQDTVLGKPAIGGTSGTFLCGEETLPNFTFCGAYFDGTRIYPIQPASMEVDPDSRSLTLQILPEQEDYRPGDTAGVTLRLTDRDGKPVQNGNVCLGVVDEAIFAVREQDLYMGNSLYRNVYYSFPDVSASYVQHQEDVYYGEGGKGGGGDGGGVTIRENFQDTAAFLTGRTGADGTVAFRVALPDDLTQWRLTAVALDSRAYWGQSRSQLYTTLPFRIDPILSSTYLSGDTIACTVRGFGTGITGGDEVEYTAAIEGYSQPLEVTATAAAGDTTPLVFQKLPAGDYTMTVTARCGEYTDGVKRTFTVRDSALTFPIHRTVDLSREDLGDIRPSCWPVELEIYHQGQKPFMQAWQLLESDHSLRGDAQLAMEAVRQTMTTFFGEGYTHPEADIAGIQIGWEEESDQTGGLRLYSYGDADVRFSARAAVAVPELLVRYELSSYLSYIYASTTDPTDQAAILMGLAALGELGDDQRLLLETKARSGGSSVLEDAYLIAGMSYLDQSAAQKLYTQRIAPKFREEQGGLYIPQNTGYDTVENTAGALTCAILTGAADDAQKILEYLSQNAVTRFGTMRGPCQLEAALYIDRFQLKEGQLPTVRYTRDGKQQSVTLPGSGCLRMTLTREEFAALDLRVEGGGAIASVSYTGDPDQLDFTQSPRVTVTKTMDTLDEQKHLGGETTVTIKVELDPAMPYGQYRMVEWVPSNMRLRSVAREEPDDQKHYIPFSYRLDEQLLTVDFFHSKLDGNVFTLQYTATSVLDTECTLERSYAYCAETMEGGRTEKGEFLPSDYYYLGVGYLFRKE